MKLRAVLCSHLLVWWNQVAAG